MTPFQFTWKAQGAILHIAIIGSIDEEALIAPVDMSPFSQIDVDLSAVKAINSIGIRTWMNWIKSIPVGKTSLTFHQVPRCMMIQFSMIQGFLPKGARVATCMVPLYCEKCEKASEVTVDAGFLRQIKTTDLRGQSIQKSLCKNTEDCELSFDISMPKYLSVLNRDAKA